MGEAGRRDAEAGGARALHHVFRQRRGGEIEIADRRAEREVAHRAADQPRLFALAVQRRERAGEPARLEQAAVGEPPVAQCRAGRSFDPSRHEHAVLDMGRDVDALAARREQRCADQPASAAARPAITRVDTRLRVQCSIASGQRILSAR